MQKARKPGFKTYAWQGKQKWNDTFIVKFLSGHLHTIDRYFFSCYLDEKHLTVSWLFFFFLLCNILAWFDKVSPNVIMLNSGIMKFNFLLAFLAFSWNACGFPRDFLSVITWSAGCFGKVRWRGWLLSVCHHVTGANKAASGVTQ